MTCNLTNHFGQFVVAREDGATVAIAAKRLAGEEAGASDGSEVAALAAFVAGAKALGGVLDHRNAMFGGYRVDSVKVCALPVQAHWNDGLGARGDGSFEQCRIEVVGARIDVHIHRFGAKQGYGFRRGDVGEAGGDDFVAWADS